MEVLDASTPFSQVRVPDPSRVANVALGPLLFVVFPKNGDVHGKEVPSNDPDSASQTPKYVIQIIVGFRRCP